MSIPYAGVVAESKRAGSVQSVQRALGLLEQIGEAGGDVAISDLAERSGLPVPTTHRLLQTMVQLGYVHQLPNRRYGLGARLARLGEEAARQLGGTARPVLAALVRDLGETANLALLDGDQMVYIAQSPSPHSMRMFTEVGNRAFVHSSGVGKAVAAQRPARWVDEVLERTGMPASTPYTLTEPDQLHAYLAVVRERGYAVDEEEHERGVRCYAVAVPGVQGAPSTMAVSVTGPTTRLDQDFALRAVPRLHEAAAAVARLLS